VGGKGDDGFKRLPLRLSVTEKAILIGNRLPHSWKGMDGSVGHNWV
jgi:hypothetical protein